MLNRLKQIGNLLLILCQRKKKFEQNKEKKSFEQNKIKIYEQNKIKFLVNFNIKNYINILYYDINLYPFLKKLNIISDKILEYNLNLKINNSKIDNFQLKINYKIYIIIFRYALIPDKLFDRTAIIKLEVYFNSIKINEEIIYNSNNNIIKYIIEYLYKINNKIITNNYNIEINKNYILFKKI